MRERGRGVGRDEGKERDGERDREREGGIKIMKMRRRER